jgi:starch synthase
LTAAIGERRIRELQERGPGTPRRPARKRALQQQAGLPASSRTPLVALVSPLDEAHGFDRVAAILECLVQLEVQLVATSAGASPYAALLRRYASAYPRRVCCLPGTAADTAEHVLAAADLLLAPGDPPSTPWLARLALARGAIPILAREGAAACLLLDASKAPQRGLAFTFERGRADSLLAAIRRGLAAHSDRPRWRRIRARARRASRMREF